MRYVLTLIVLFIFVQCSGQVGSKSRPLGNAETIDGHVPPPSRGLISLTEFASTIPPLQPDINELSCRSLVPEVNPSELQLLNPAYTETSPETEISISRFEPAGLNLEVSLLQSPRVYAPAEVAQKSSFVIGNPQIAYHSSSHFVLVNLSSVVLDKYVFGIGILKMNGTEYRRNILCEVAPQMISVPADRSLFVGSQGTSTKPEMVMDTQNDLIGRWYQKCHQAGLTYQRFDLLVYSPTNAPKGIQATAPFTHTGRLTTSVYNDSLCRHERMAYTVSRQVELSYSGNAKDDPSLLYFDFITRLTAVQIRNNEWAAFANASRLCDRTDWKSGNLLVLKSSECGTDPLIRSGTVFHAAVRKVVSGFQAVFSFNWPENLDGSILWSDRL